MSKTFNWARRAVSARIVEGLVLVTATGLIASVVPSCHAHAAPVNDGAGRVYELRTYHVLPGKMAALEARFRDTTSKLLAKHDLKVAGFWIGDDNTFIFLVSHGSRDEAKVHWAAMQADPEFQDVIKSEMADKTVDKVDVVFLAPTDFSMMR